MIFSLSCWLEMSHQIGAILSNVLSNREKENSIDCQKEEKIKANWWGILKRMFFTVLVLCRDSVIKFRLNQFPLHRSAFDWLNWALISITEDSTSRKSKIVVCTKKSRFHTKRVGIGLTTHIELMLWWLSPFNRDVGVVALKKVFSVEEE